LNSTILVFYLQGFLDETPGTYVTSVAAIKQSKSGVSYPTVTSYLPSLILRIMESNKLTP
jgi:hypothetical protein